MGWPEKTHLYADGGLRLPVALQQRRKIQTGTRALECEHAMTTAVGIRLLEKKCPEPGGPREGSCR
jgi:hypothetical protein